MAGTVQLADLAAADPAERLENFERAILECIGVDPDEAFITRCAGAYANLSDALTRDRDAVLAAQPSATVGGAVEEAVAGLLYAARTFHLSTRLLAAYAPPPGPLVELGAGWSPFALAAAVHGTSRICLIDAISERLSRATALFSLLGAPKPDVVIADAGHPPSSTRPWSAIGAPFVLNEMLARFPPTDRPAAGAEIVSRWLTFLAPGGRLYILEPGVRESGRVLQEIRDRIRSTCRVLAPCTRAGPCPLLPLPRDWCHLTLPYPAPPITRQVAAAAGRRHDEIHFAWLILESSPPTPTTDRWRLLEVRRHERPKARLMLCGPDGYSALTVLRRDSALFDSLTNLAPGAILRIDPSGLETKGDGRRVTAQATVDLHCEI